MSSFCGSGNDENDYEIGYREGAAVAFGLYLMAQTIRKRYRPRLSSAHRNLAERLIGEVHQDALSTVRIYHPEWEPADSSHPEFAGYVREYARLTLEDSPKYDEYYIPNKRTRSLVLDYICSRYPILQSPTSF